MKQKEKVIQHYTEEYAEETRFANDPAHKVEFLVTMHHLKKFISPGMHILEIGAGSGAYTQAFSDLGCHVDAVDITPRHVTLLEQRFKDDPQVRIFLGDARNLEQFQQNQYDIVVEFGPMYHYGERSDRITIIKEAVNVAKEGGVIFFAYCLQDNPLIKYGFCSEQILQELHSVKYDRDTAVILENTGSVFHLDTISNIRNITKEAEVKFPIREEGLFAQDGITPIIADKVNAMNEEEYAEYIQYLIASSGKQELIGYSAHIVQIFRKKDYQQSKVGTEKI